MSQFIITYLGGNQPATPEEGQRHFAKYKEWLTSLGQAAISPANPFAKTNTITPDGNITPGSSMNMSGYTLLEADSMAVAMEHAKSCPFLEIGGSLEVSEIMSMKF